jgi:hypothetical protein
MKIDAVETARMAIASANPTRVGFTSGGFDDELERAWGLTIIRAVNARCDRVLAAKYKRNIRIAPLLLDIEDSKEYNFHHKYLKNLPDGRPTQRRDHGF